MQKNSFSPFPTRLMYNLPPYLVFTARLMTHRNNLSVGINFKSMATGSRISYKDYSGEIRLDQMNSAKAFGGSLNLPVWEKNNWKLNIRIDADLVLSQVNFKNQTSIYNEQQTETLETRSLGISLEPGAVMSYTIGRFATGLDIGYFLNANGSLHLAGNSKAYLVDRSGANINADWSGLRGSLFLAYHIKR